MDTPGQSRRTETPTKPWVREPQPVKTPVSQTRQPPAHDEQPHDEPGYGHGV